jgi:ketosteroid isomerase-like protein
MTISDREVRAWLESWAEAVRNCDFAGGRTMFSNDVVAFGTVAGAVSGIDALVREQWQRVWPKTRGFNFGSPLLLAVSSEMAVVAVEWRSQGRSGSATHDRAGRATLVLRSAKFGLVCTHSHFSMAPGTTALADGFEEGRRQTVS